MKYPGPTPEGEYLIDTWQKHRTLRIDWYNLLPRKEDKSGYYPYDEKTRGGEGRNQMGLHPGTVSEGCVTVHAKKYDDDPCWKALKKIVEKGKMKYKGMRFKGFLLVAK